MEAPELLRLLFSIRRDSSDLRVIIFCGFGWNVWPCEHKSGIHVHTVVICSFPWPLQSGALQNSVSWMNFSPENLILGESPLYL